MAYDENLALRVRLGLARHGAVREIKMFGGLAFMLNAHMCLGVLGDQLIVRVGRDGHAWALTQPHCRPMVFHFRTITGFVTVSARGHRHGSGLAKWIKRGVDFARSLPVRPLVRPRRGRKLSAPCRRSR